MSAYDFDWNDLAFANKKPVRQLKATFIAAPRVISSKRFVQIIKEYLPKGNLIIGIAKEAFVDGFELQPHFQTLQQSQVQKVIDQVNNSTSPHKIYVLNYFQRDTDSIVEKLRFKHVVLVNGSWLNAFHNRSTYYVLSKTHTVIDFVSPFADESEAKDYSQKMRNAIEASSPSLSSASTTVHQESAMIDLADQAAKYSFDYTFQTGAVLGKRAATGDYEFVAFGYNKVVPFEAYALHHGASREKHFSPPNDLNYYDTIHAEVDILLTALRQSIRLDGLALFINLLPCPHCARMLSQTSISEIVYRQDHSAGYAIKILEMAGKTVRRLV